MDRHIPCLRNGNHPPISKILTRNCSYLKKIQELCGTEAKRNAIQRLPLLRIHLIMQTPNPDTMADVKELSEPDQYRCRCSQPTIRLNTRTPREELGKRLKELKEIATPLEEQQYQLTRICLIPQSSQELNHQSQIHMGGTHGSSCICSREWPYLTSIEGEALDLVEAQYLSILRW
jgi:hypothetical protein